MPTSFVFHPIFWNSITKLQFYTEANKLLLKLYDDSDEVFEFEDDQQVFLAENGSLQSNQIFGIIYLTDLMQGIMKLQLWTWSDLLETHFNTVLLEKWSAYL